MLDEVNMNDLELQERRIFCQISGRLRRGQGCTGNGDRDEIRGKWDRRDCSNSWLLPQFFAFLISASINIILDVLTNDQFKSSFSINQLINVIEYFPSTRSSHCFCGTWSPQWAPWYFAEASSSTYYLVSYLALDGYPLLLMHVLESLAHLYVLDMRIFCFSIPWHKSTDAD